MKKLTLLLFITSIFAIEWTPVGPGGGGAMYTPSISPHSSNRIFISCDMSGLYKTTDKGNSWEMINFNRIKSSNSIPTLFHPSDSLTVWDEDYRDWTDNLRKSTDGGITWSSVWEYPGWISDIMVLPDEPLVILAALPDEGLYRCTNGNDFSQITETGYSYLAWNNNGVYAGNDENLTFSNNRGISFSTVDISTPGYIEDLTAGNNSIFILQSEYIYRSTDNGTSWSIVLESAPFERGYFNIIRAHGEYVWVTTHGSGRQQPTVFLSSNNGDTFDAVFFCNDSWDDTSNLERGWLSLDFVCGWGGPPDGFNISHTDNQIAVWTDNGRALATFNAGTTWTCIYSNFEGSGERTEGMPWSSRGLEVTSSWNIHIPQSSDYMRIAYTDIQGAWSDDNGNTWHVGSEGIPDSWSNTNYDLVKDTENDILFGAFSGVHDIIGGWSFNSWDRTGYGGVAYSEDDGQFWTPIYGGLPDLPITSIAIDQTSSVSSRTLYCAVWSNGIWRSTDNGTTWTRTSEGLECGDGTCTSDGPNTHIVQVEVHPDGTVFALKTKYIRSGSIIKNDGGLYKSTDMGATWTSISDYVEDCTPVSWIDTEDEHSWADPISFTLDEENSNHIWVSACNVNNGKIQGGLYETTDGGSNWNRILEIYGAFRLTKSQYVDSLLYLASKSDGLLYSTDLGETWLYDEQFPFSSPTRIIEDPDEEDIIWVNTFGGGVFKGRTSFTEVGENEYSPSPTKMELTAFPNPFNSSVEITSSQKSSIRIYDIWGNEVYKNANSTTYSWTPEDNTSGLYLIQSEDFEEKTNIVKKIYYIK